MSSASPQLESVLNQFNEQRRSTRRYAQERADALAAIRQALDDTQSIGRDRRADDVKEIHASLDSQGSRWMERLRRIDDWKKALTGAQQASNRFSHLVERIRWFDRAEALTQRLSASLLRQAVRINSLQRSYEADFQAWLPYLQEQQSRVDQFHAKQKQQPTPLLVSRARKQEDLVYVQNQERVAEALWSTLQPLRRRVTHLVGRIYRANRALETAANENPMLFEVRKTQMVSALESAQQELFALRDRLLKNSLEFEAARKHLLALREEAQKLRCVEEVYKKPAAWWEKPLQRLTSHKR